MDQLSFFLEGHIKIQRTNIYNLIFIELECFCLSLNIIIEYYLADYYFFFVFQFEMLVSRKDPRQVFQGLEPGWLVNLADKVILKPTDEVLQSYYNS